MENKLNFIIDENVTETIEAIKKKVKFGKLKIQKKKVKAAVLKKYKPEDLKRNKILKAARKKAHGTVPDTKREISNKMRKNLNTLSENFDFIEESCGYAVLDISFFDEAKAPSSISENFSSSSKFKTLGIAEGVFAPIGAMSRNGRKYDDDHFPYILENQNMVNKVQGRGMLGTIGHHDKKVDDDDLARGLVSHIVSDLRIVDEEDGTRNLHGKLEILDTPAGNLLKSYYESGVPLYVSSRGAGKLLQVANENYKRVDKTSYFLETFDIVKEPGFLQAKPKYLGESNIEEDNIVEENHEEENMKSSKVDTKQINEEAMESKVAITPDMEVEEVVKRLTNPLNEQLLALTEAVKNLTDKIFEKEDEEAKEEKTEKEDEEAKEEKTEKTEKEDETEKVTEELEETVTEAVEAVEEVTETVEETVTEEVEAVEETVTEEVEAVEEVSESVDLQVKKEETESAEEKKAPVATELAVAHAEPSAQLVEEETSYKQKYEECEEIVEGLLELITNTSKKVTKIQEELNEYKLSEEFGITKEEAKAKLQNNDYESIKEELSAKDETVETVTEELEETATEEVEETVTEETVTEEVDETEKEIKEIAEKITEELVEAVTEEVEETKPAKRAFSIFNTSEAKEPRKGKKAFSIFS